VLFGGEIGGVLEPDIAGAGEFGMVFAFEAADLIDGIVDEADDVELVEGNVCVGEVFGSAFFEGGGHVGADIGDGEGITVVGLEVWGEGGDGGGILAGGDEQNFALGEIDEEGNVVLAAAGGGFINADLGD